MISEEPAGGKTDLVAMVQQGKDSGSISIHCNHQCVIWTKNFDQKAGQVAHKKLPVLCC